MKKITLILAGLICMLATSCMFAPMKADFTITNNTDTDIAYMVYYNQKIPRTTEFISAGETVKKTITGNLSKFDLHDSSGGAGITWMTKDYYDEKKNFIISNGETRSDYIIMTLEYSDFNPSTGKLTTYEDGTYQTVPTIADSYSITFTGGNSSIACELKVD